MVFLGVNSNNDHVFLWGNSFWHLLLADRYVVHLPPSFGTGFKCSLCESKENPRNSIQWQVAGIGSDWGCVLWCENGAVIGLSAGGRVILDRILLLPLSPSQIPSLQSLQGPLPGKRRTTWSLDMTQSPSYPRRNGGQLIPLLHSWGKIPEFFTLGILSKDHLCMQDEFTESFKKIKNTQSLLSVIQNKMSIQIFIGRF